jgi:hypothetical protein
MSKKQDDSSYCETCGTCGYIGYFVGFVNSEERKAIENLEVFCEEHKSKSQKATNTERDV